MAFGAIVGMPVIFGAFGFALSQLVFVYVVVQCARGKGITASSEVWEHPKGLEWTVPSPAPYHTFDEPPQVEEGAAFP